MMLLLIKTSLCFVVSGLGEATVESDLTSLSYDYVTNLVFNAKRIGGEESGVRGWGKSMGWEMKGRVSCQGVWQEKEQKLVLIQVRNELYNVTEIM